MAAEPLSIFMLLGSIVARFTPPAFPMPGGIPLIGTFPFLPIPWLVLMKRQGDSSSKRAKENFGEMFDTTKHFCSLPGYCVTHVVCQSADGIRLIPSFSFVDPFGYKGLSLKIVNGVIKDWGSDCVFFFNYGRINAGTTNPLVKPHIDALFGTGPADALRKALPGKTPNQREVLILEELAQAIKEMGGTYVLPFRFKRGNRTSHSLIFVSKHFKGYEIMKIIMAKESSTEDQGVASFA
jgi:hypothetical protein